MESRLQEVITDQAPQAIGHYAQAVRAGGFLFLSGQIAIEAKTGTLQLFDGDVVQQMALILKNIEALLLSQGLSKNSIVKITIFMTDLSQFGKLNAVYSQFFGNHKPARSTVEVSRLPKDVAIEIEAIACLS